jgi:hypothetical protein
MPLPTDLKSVVRKDIFRTTENGSFTIRCNLKYPYPSELLIFNSPF